MHQRAAILQTLREAGQEHGATTFEAAAGTERTAVPAQAGPSKAQAFLDLMREQPELCWDELAKQFRENYYDAIDDIIPRVLALDDPLITLNCVRFADLSQPKEVEILRAFVRDADPERHQFSLRELAEKQDPEIRAALGARTDLPSSVLEVLDRPATPPNRRGAARRQTTGPAETADGPA